MPEVSGTSGDEWSEAKWLEAILRRELKRNADFLARLCVKLEEGEDYATDTPLYGLLKTTAELLLGSLPDVPQDQLEHVNLLLSTTATFLRYAERSRVAHTPWSMIRCTESFLKDQVGSSYSFIIRPQWSYNYSLVGEFVELYHTYLASRSWFPIQDWERKVRFGKDKIYCISFPRIERLNCLLHAIWGHELGHIVVADWATQEFGTLWQEWQLRITDAIRKEAENSNLTVHPLFKEMAINKKIADDTKVAMDVAKQGTTELLCDAVAVHLFGPAAVAAMTEFASRFDLDLNPLSANFYPPWRYRLRLMVDACHEDLNQAEQAIGKDNPQNPETILSPFIRWLKNARLLTLPKDDINRLQLNVITREVYKEIEKAWPNIRSAVIARLASSKAPYQVHLRQAAVADLIRKLQLDLPPNETGYWPDATPALFPDILNAAWAYKFAELERNALWGAADEFEKLFRLVLKGIEASQVSREYAQKTQEQS